MAAIAVASVLAGSEGIPAVDAVGYDGRSPRPAPGGSQRVLIELDRAPLALVRAERRAAGEPMPAAEQRRYLRSLEREGFSLRGALKAKGIAVRRVRTMGRLWHGFAATVPASQLPRLQAAGLRLRPVRRFYPASVRTALVRPPAGRGPVGGTSGQPTIAVIDSGADYRHPGLGGGIGPGKPVAAGYDVIDADADPRPGRATEPASARLSARAKQALESHGSETAGALVGPRGFARGQRIMVIRAAAMSADPLGRSGGEEGSTDTVVAGLERAVDPDGDGSLEDALPVALVGLNAPFAGFERAVEARAIEAASAAGTLVVAPAGNEGEPAAMATRTGGRSSGRPALDGTIGSPGASPAALTAGALAVDRVARRAEVTLRSQAGEVVRLDGAVLAGEAARGARRLVALRGLSLADRRGRRPGFGTAPGEYLTARGASRVAGRVVALRRGGSAVAQATAATAAGAAGVLLCDPERRVPLSPLGSAGVPLPVIGLSGEAASRALALARGRTTVTIESGGEPDPAPGEGPAAFTSRGPTFALLQKPDIAGPAATLTTTGAGHAISGGTGVAAAWVAAMAGSLRTRRPDLMPAEIAALVRQTAKPVDGADAARAAGAGLPDPGAALATPVIAVPEPGPPPRPPDRPWSAVQRFRLRNASEAAVRVRLEARFDEAPSGVRARVSPARLNLEAGASAPVIVRVGSPPLGRETMLAGALVLGGDGHGQQAPFAVAVAEARAPALSRLRLRRAHGRVGMVRGVVFDAGAITRDRSRLAVSVRPVDRLVLELVGVDGGGVRALTPPGGALELLPARYAYTLPRSTLERLPAGTYAFRARAKAGAQGSRVVRRSAPFTLEGK